VSGEKGIGRFWTLDFDYALRHCYEKFGIGADEDIAVMFAEIDPMVVDIDRVFRNDFRYRESEVELDKGDDIQLHAVCHLKEDEIDRLRRKGNPDIERIKGTRNIGGFGKCEVINGRITL
jgi:hypothetical protein